MRFKFIFVAVVVVVIYRCMLILTCFDRDATLKQIGNDLPSSHTFRNAAPVPHYAPDCVRLQYPADIAPVAVSDFLGRRFPKLPSTIPDGPEGPRKVADILGVHLGSSCMFPLVSLFNNVKYSFFW